MLLQEQEQEGLQEEDSIERFLLQLEELKGCGAKLIHVVNSDVLLLNSLISPVPEDEAMKTTAEVQSASIIGA